MAQNYPKIRPLPQPPRCKGMLNDWEEGKYSGCAYADGDLAPFTAPCDCPVCEGSGIEPIRTTLPHQLLGGPNCPGCLNGMIRRDRAEIICNECDAIVRSVPVSELQRTLDELELSLNTTSEKCPHCGTVNLFPGFSRMVAFVCRACGTGVSLPESLRNEPARTTWKLLWPWRKEPPRSD